MQRAHASRREGLTLRTRGMLAEPRERKPRDPHGALSARLSPGSLLRDNLRRASTGRRRSTARGRTVSYARVLNFNSRPRPDTPPRLVPCLRSSEGVGARCSASRPTTLAVTTHERASPTRSVRARATRRPHGIPFSRISRHATSPDTVHPANRLPPLPPPRQAPLTLARFRKSLEGRNGGTPKFPLDSFPPGKEGPIRDRRPRCASTSSTRRRRRKRQDRAWRERGMGEGEEGGEPEDLKRRRC